MGILGVVKQSITGKPLTIKDPTFIKESCSAQEQLAKLENLMKIAPTYKAKQIEQDIKMLSYGIIGEKNVAFELKNSHMPILILHDLFLEYNGLTAQIDYVIIDTRFVLIIECKNMVGDIEVTSKGDFIRSFKSKSGKVYKREGIYSPIVQNQRHVELVKKILIDNMKSINKKKCQDVIKSIVVMANPKSILNIKYAKKENKNQIIKHDQLINHMKSLHKANKDGYWFPEEGMNRVAEILKGFHRENPVDYTNKYNLGTTSDTKFDNSFVHENSEDVSATKVKSPEPNVNIVDTPIYLALKQYRYNKSKEEGIKAYFIYNNAQMEEIIRAMPITLDGLRKIKGFAEVKCQKYGEDIIAIVNKHI